MLRKASLYLRTLPHLRSWQIVGRLVAPARARLTRAPDIPDRLAGHLAHRVEFLRHDPWNRREDILNGRFCFLNRTADLGRPVDWHPSHLPLLWRFNLHYFQYLHLLSPDEQVALCRSWHDANASPGGVAWHPYPTSHRIVNWCKANMATPALHASLYRQCAHLSRNLETYVYGNHLLENARALVFAGRFFGGVGESSDWLRQGLGILRSEADEQILLDGGHYERSPMYHALMLELYLDVLNILDADDTDVSWIEATVQSMTEALASMTHPDGEIALFNDATFEIAPSSSELQGYAARLGATPPVTRRDLPETGYYVHASDDTYLIVDAGPGGPDHLMAHAHADVFSYELSIGGKRFIVDTGVFDYEAGADRQWARSTTAHNTVAVDGLDQFECWGRFRVARRSPPHSISCRRDGSTTMFEGSFSGYGRRIGDDIVHRRTITVDDVDRIIRVRDAVAGRGRHLVETRIHFHPDARRGGGDPREIVIGSHGCRLEIIRGDLRWENRPYFPRFGERTERTVAVIGGMDDLPVELEYVIRY